MASVEIITMRLSVVIQITDRFKISVFPSQALEARTGFRVETNLKDKGEQDNSGHGMSYCMSREAECSIRTGREIRKDQNIISELQVERKIQHHE